MRRINIDLPSRDELSLIKQYLHLTKGVHGLSDRSIDLVAVLIKISRKENGDLTSILTSSDSRAHLRDSVDMGESMFNTMLSRLKKANVIINNKLVGIYNSLHYDEQGCILNINLKLSAQES